MKHIYFQNTILIHMAEYFFLCRLSTAKWNAKLNIKCQAPTQPSLYTQGEDLWFTPGLLDQLCPKYQQTHIHMAVEKLFIFSVLGNLLWDDSSPSITSLRKNFEAELTRRIETEGKAVNTHCGWSSPPGCASAGLELSTQTAITDLARGCGSLEAAGREGMMDAHGVFYKQEE